MCKLITLYSERPLKGKELASVRAAVAAQIPALLDEKDGIATLVHGEKLEVRREVGVENYRSVLNDTIAGLEGARCAILHTRTATTGPRDIDGAHLWEVDGRYLAHNGIVASFSQHGGWAQDGQRRLPVYTGGTMSSRGPQTDVSTETARNLIERCKDCRSIDEPCERHTQLAIALICINEDVGKPRPVDSYRFLECVSQQMDEGDIAESVRVTGFNGIASMYEPETRKLWHIATRPAVLHTNGDSWGIAYSYVPEMPTASRRIAGWPCPSDAAHIKAIRKQEVVPGVHMIG